jgi:hypothetical protein
MALTLLQRYLLHADPIHRGFTRAGIANAVTLTHGRSFPRILGGFNLRRGTAPAVIDDLVGASGPDASSIAMFGWVPQAADTTYWFECAAIGGGGVETAAAATATDPQRVRVRTDGTGAVPSPVPGAPRGLRVDPRAGGVLRVQWTHAVTGHDAQAALFNVYHNNGTGAIDYDTPLATVTARAAMAGLGIYEYVTAAYVDGTTVQFGVRAESAAGDEELNTVTAAGTADATGPADHEIESVAYGEDE